MSRLNIDVIARDGLSGWDPGQKKLVVFNLLDSDICRRIRSCTNIIKFKFYGMYSKNELTINIHCS